MSLDMEQFVEALIARLEVAAAAGERPARVVLNCVIAARDAATTERQRVVIMPGHVRRGMTGTVIGKVDGCYKVILDKGVPGIILVPETLCAPEGAISDGDFSKETVDTMYKRIGAAVATEGAPI